MKAVDEGKTVTRRPDLVRGRLFVVPAEIGNRDEVKDKEPEMPAGPTNDEAWLLLGRSECLYTVITSYLRMVLTSKGQ